jgi:uncharacterized glyoxalase superfamily protein PhnB
MFSDILSGFHQTKGTNAVLTLWFRCKEEQQRFFAELSEGEKAHATLKKIFWIELYVMVTDKF